MMDDAVHFTQIIRNQSSLSIVLLHAEDGDHGTCWYYIELDRNKEKAFHKAVETGDSYTITDYGRVISSGWGATPDPATVQLLRAEGLI